ncbi:MAG: hypothetical protein CMJ78_19720 [Planctomycetaceae bacterium]|nr:hypothetical protein [Planctomycetaceae bacterium]
MPRLMLLIALALLPVGSLLADSELNSVRSFLRQHCFECHGDKKQENDLRFDNISPNLKDHETLETWQAIVDQLNRGSMPPKGRPRPDAKENAKVIDAITSALKLAYEQQKSTGGKTVMRRLNRHELRSTLRDLLYLQGNADYDSLLVTKLEDRNGNGRAQWNSDDPTREFPADQIEEGFDNIGSRLVMSDFLLKQIIGAAEYSLGIATHLEKKPDLAVRRYESPIRTEGPGGWLQRYSRDFVSGYDGIYQRYREPGASTGGLGRVSSRELSRNGVGLTTQYRISIEVSGHNQKHEWGELIKSRQDEEFLVGLHIADAKRGGLGENPTSRQLTQWKVPGDGTKRTLTFDCWLDSTWLPWVGWDNAPYSRGLKPSQLVEKFYPDEYSPPPAKNASREEKNAYEPNMVKALFAKGYRGPQLRIYSLSIEPLDKLWPPQSHVALYGKSADVSVATLVLRFARRAFRRPVEVSDVARYVGLVESQIKAGVDRAEALRAGYTAIIASPRFYYLQESTGRLDSYELASRLSYFLWSTMPDDELFKLAEDNKLVEPDVLSAQVDRMLNDPRAVAFFRRFPERWLRIDKLGSMPPPGGFYFHRAMEVEMREQIDAFFADLVKTNGPIRHFVDSDYTFLNERTSQWIYRRDDVWGDAFRKVAAKAPHGGGILTMPALMTATANGVDTSPVVRGVWVLESILGTPPASPPPDVDPVSPDLRSAKTIRDQLVAHRQQEACSKCHRKIDPLGFAFENFDELGLWRTHYRGSGRNLPIDSSATFSNGPTVKNIDDLKQHLLKSEQLITRNLTTKLLSYASGRAMEPLDRGEVDAIVDKLKKKSGGMRDLIKLVVLSDVFLTK